MAKTSDIIFIINCKDRKITTSGSIDPSNKIIIADEHNGIGSDQGVVNALNNVISYARQQGYRKFWIADSDLFGFSTVLSFGTKHVVWKSSGGEAIVNDVLRVKTLDFKEVEVPDDVCYASLGFTAFAKFQHQCYNYDSIPLAFKFYDLDLLGDDFSYEVPASKSERWFEDIDLALKLKQQGKKTCKINKYGYSSLPWNKDTNSILMEEGTKTRNMWIYNTYKKWGDNLKISKKKGVIKTIQHLPKEIVIPVKYTFDISSFENFIADVDKKLTK